MSLANWLRRRLGRGGGGQESGEPERNRREVRVSREPEYGNMSSSPGMNEMRSALQGDYQRSTEQDQVINQGRLESLGQFGGAVGSARDFNKAMLDRTEGQGRGDIDQFLRNSSYKRENALEWGRGELNNNITDTYANEQRAVDELERGASNIENLSQQNLQTLQGSQDYLGQQMGKFEQSMAGTEAALDQQTQNAWQAGANALASFRDTTSQQMAQWGTGFMQSQRASKEQLARQLAAEGYRPEEIEAELRKSDRQAAQTQAQQLATFQIQEEQTRRGLELEYNKAAIASEASANNVRGQLRGIEASFRTQATQTHKELSGMMAATRQWAGDSRMQAERDKASVHQWGTDRRNASRQMKVQLEQWGSDSEKSAEMAALDARSRLTMQRQQIETTGVQMELQGYQGLAAMWQGASTAMTPFAPFVMQQMGLQMSLEDRQFGSEGAGLGLIFGGLSALMGQANSLAGMARGSG